MILAGLSCSHCGCAWESRGEGDSLASARTAVPAASTVDAGRAPIPPAQEAAVRIGLVGDVNLAISTGRILQWRSAGLPLPDDVADEFPFASVRERLLQADLLIGNLECAVALGGQPSADRLPFRAPLEALDVLQSVGFDVLSVANNHSSDLGVAGFDETVRRVSSAGFAVAGARGGFGPEPQQPVVRVVRGLRVCVLAYPAVDPSKAAADAAAARPQCDLLLAFNHWGMEGCAEPTGDQIALAHALIDAGADLVAGTHVHRIQPEERYRGRWILYGLGDFVFAGNPGLPQYPGAYVELDVGRQGVLSRRWYRVEHDRHGAPYWMDPGPAEPAVFVPAGGAAAERP